MLSFIHTLSLVKYLFEIYDFSAIPTEYATNKVLLKGNAKLVLFLRSSQTQLYEGKALL